MFHLVVNGEYIDESTGIENDRNANTILPTTNAVATAPPSPRRRKNEDEQLWCVQEEEDEEKSKEEVIYEEYSVELK